MPRPKPPKEQFKVGSAKEADYWYWINERHNIYVRREAGAPWPWTEDKILQEWKFTNAFRQLDRGTLALRKLLEYSNSLSCTAWTICWYRMYNLDEHANYWISKGMTPLNYGELWEYLRHKVGKIFTGAFMTTGRKGFSLKEDGYRGPVEQLWLRRHEIADVCKSTKSMQQVTKFLRENFLLIGNFNAYEMVCDFRFTELLDDATDKLKWTNMGPGAHRGLKRLGLTGDPVKEMKGLLRRSRKNVSEDVKSCEWPWEMREIEHCLCEFDKYERVKAGGRPRSRFRWN